MPALQPPRRPVPAALILSALLARWSWAGASALLLLAGLALPLFFEPRAVLWAAVAQHEAVSAEGEVTVVREGAGALRFRPVSSVTFHYTVAGRRYTGVSFAQGAAPREGARVPVQVWAQDPGLAVVAGLDPGRMAPTAALLPLALGLAALGLGLAALRQGLRAVRLLREGLLTPARLVAKEDTGRKVNGFPVVRLVFDLDGRRVEQTTLEPERFAQDQPHPFLHPPGAPEAGLLLREAAPGAAVGPEGVWVGTLSPAARLSAAWTVVCGAVALGGGLWVVAG